MTAKGLEHLRGMPLRYLDLGLWGAAQGDCLEVPDLEGMPLEYFGAGRVGPYSHERVLGAPARGLSLPFGT